MQMKDTYTKAEVAELLREFFPWLDTDDEIQSCADQIDILTWLYRDLTEGK